MDYQKIYNQLIERAIERGKPNCYSEIHHIIPRSEGGDNTDNNLVTLTAREHFIAHKLLYIIDPNNNSRRTAYLMMSNRFNIKWGNVYEEAKKLFSENHHYKTDRIREIMAKPKTDEHKKKISIANAGKAKTKEHIDKIKANLPDRNGENNPNYGKGSEVVVDGISYLNVVHAYKALGVKKSTAYHRLKSPKWTNWLYK